MAVGQLQVCGADRLYRCFNRRACGGTSWMLGLEVGERRIYIMMGATSCEPAPPPLRHCHHALATSRALRNQYELISFLDYCLAVGEPLRRTRFRIDTRRPLVARDGPSRPSLVVRHSLTSC
jgi:hypothetical protein